MRKAWKTATEYASSTLESLLGELRISKNDKAWRDELAPFAPVWAAMISAAARDYCTAVDGGVVDGTVQARPDDRDC